MRRKRADSGTSDWPDWVFERPPAARNGDEYEDVPGIGRMRKITSDRLNWHIAEKKFADSVGLDDRELRYLRSRDPRYWMQHYNNREVVDREGFTDVGS